jgi:hypothetical protein
MTGHAVYHLSFVICRSLSVIGSGAGNWKIRDSRRHRSGGGRIIALEISNLVWLARTPARRYFHREGQFQILFSARYLHSHQHCAHPGGLDLEAVTDRVSVRLLAPDFAGYAGADAVFALLQGDRLMG